MKDPKTDEGAVLCEARGVTHEFRLPDGKPLRVVEKVDLTVRPGEIVALLGPSGCGKSTILRILAGLVAPTAGEVLYRGEPVTGVNPGIGIVFQSFALFPWMTVTENIEVVLKAAGLDEPAIQERAAQSVRVVGLAGFDSAYPRELSGGMKQRVGMARALAVRPEVLFMDEPFSHVDALTAEGLRAEVVDIWARSTGHPSSILLVSHDIREVAFMADRIVVLGAHPGRVRTVLENTLARPRDYRSPELQRFVDQLHELIVGHELPDPSLPAMAEPAPDVPEPLPEATNNDIVGLLEYLDARKGREDVFRIAVDTHQPFGHVINVVKAAEMLDLIDTPRRQVVLTADGRRFLEATHDDRHAIWRTKLEGLVLFREIGRELEATAGRPVPEEQILELLHRLLPGQDHRLTLETLVRWGRFGHLFTYDEEARTLLFERRREPRAAAPTGG